MNLVKKSLILCIGMLLALIGLQAGQSLLQVSRLAAANHEIVASDGGHSRAKNLWSEFLDAEQTWRQATAFVDAAGAEELRKAFGQKSATLRIQVERLNSAASGSVQESAKAVSAKVDAWLALAAPHVGEAGVTELPSFHRLDAARDELSAEITRLVDLSDAASAAAIASSSEVERAAYYWTIGELVAAVALGLVMGWWALRSLHAQLGADASEVARVANAVAAGDIAVPIDSRGVPPASVMAAMARMQQALLETVSRVRGISGNLSVGADEIAGGNADLSRRTELQAAALEQTALTMQRLDQAVKLNTGSANQAGVLAEQASSVAARGGAVVGEAVVTMRAINDSSKRIADIIGVIDGIAFQTNILALNAAVEAARAGDQGRGFAVVASEVRSLAKRSADAAKEIKHLIGASVERVEAGSTLIERAGSTMQEVVTSIERVSAVMGEIRSASSAQSAGVAEVGQAIDELDRTTQQNAALAEESAAAADSLKSQGLQLVEAVSFFRLAEGSAGNGLARMAPVTAPRVTVPLAAAHVAPAARVGVDRRGPGRATNVHRPAFGRGERQHAPSATVDAAHAPAAGTLAALKATGTDGKAEGDWETF